jgi:uncharacterized cupin superfamily protein
MMALADREPVNVIGEHGLLRDRPGFEMSFITRGSASAAPQAHARHSVLMPMRGYWKLAWTGGDTVLNPGDTALIPAGLAHAVTPSMTGEASLYRVIGTDDPAGPTWKPN